MIRNNKQNISYLEIHIHSIAKSLHLKFDEIWKTKIRGIRKIILKRTTDIIKCHGVTLVNMSFKYSLVLYKVN